MAELDPPAQGALLSEPIGPADPAVWREWAERVRDAASRGACLRVRGGGSKDHLGDTTRGELLDTRGCQGIVAYEPSELVIRARAGTPLAEVETALAERGQHLAFEPPRFAFHADGSGANTLRLSFSCADAATIEEGISRLGRLLGKERLAA